MQLDTLSKCPKVPAVEHLAIVSQDLSRQTYLKKKKIEKRHKSKPDMLTIDKSQVASIPIVGDIYA